MAQRFEQIPHQRKSAEANQYMKICSMPYIIKEMKIKTIINTTTPYQNGQNPGYWQQQMLVRMWSNGNSHSSLVKMQNGYNILGDSLAVSHKTNHAITTWNSNCVPYCLFKRVENLCQHKNLHMVVIELLFTWNTECYSALKINALSSHEKTFRNHKFILRSKRRQLEKAIYWFQLYDTLGKAELWDNKN